MCSLFPRQLFRKQLSDTGLYGRISEPPDRATHQSFTAQHTRAFISSSESRCKERFLFWWKCWFLWSCPQAWVRFPLLDSLLHMRGMVWRPWAPKYLNILGVRMKTQSCTILMLLRVQGRTQRMSYFLFCWAFEEKQEALLCGEEPLVCLYPSD